MSNVFQAALAKDLLKRILAAPFGADGHPQGFSHEDVQWARAVVQERPAWALEVLAEALASVHVESNLRREDGR